ncbi:hypothetical protein BRC89_00085 [Halobacteriales archaeon QS_4_70_19]|nr:MAG: hypothetical protein BRC89_00085 [Halobacteriales archaeon QS_4_70_19]
MPPAVTEDLVVTSLGDRQVVALDHGGEIQWTRRFDRSVIELAGAGDTAVALTHDRSVEETAEGHGGIVALDLASGSRLWGLDFEDHIPGLTRAGLSAGAASTPLVPLHQWRGCPPPDLPSPGPPRPSRYPRHPRINGLPPTGVTT